MRIGIGLAAIALLFTSSALAADQAGPRKPGDEIICKNAGSRSGSLLLNRKVCMTRAEWQSIMANDREEVELAQLRRLQVPIPR